MKKLIAGLLGGSVILLVLLALFDGFPAEQEREARPLPAAREEAASENVPPKTRGLRVATKGTGEETVDPAPLAEGAQESGAYIHISGRVVNLDDQAVPGALVGVYELGGDFAGHRYSILQLDTYFPEAPAEDDGAGGVIPGYLVRAETTSGEDGSFVFRIPRFSDSFHLQSIGPEEAALAFDGPFSTADCPVTLRLEPALELSGFVEDGESGARLSGARVSLRAARMGSPSGPRVQQRFRTDWDGRFQFGLLSEGEYDLEVVHCGYPDAHRLEITLPGVEGDLVVSMKPTEEGQRIFGRVIDASTGYPLGEVEISLMHVFKTLSGPTGDFELRIPEEFAGIYSVHRVEARAAGYGAMAEEIGRREGAWEWNPRLEPARSLSVVVEAAGELVGGAKVIIWTGGQGGGSRRYGTTDARGRCRFSGLPAEDEARVFAHHPEHGRCIGDTVPLAVGESDDQDVVLTLSKGPAKVLVSVKDMDGAPVENAHVLLIDNVSQKIPLFVLRQSRVLGDLFGTFGGFRTARTDESGMVLFGETYEGECLAQALGPDVPLSIISQQIKEEDLARSEIEMIRAGDGDVTPCDLVLWRSVSVGGRVTTSDGTRLEGVTVNLLVQNETGAWIVDGRFVSSNKYGNYQLTGLNPNRRYAVCVPRVVLDRPQSMKWKEIAADRRGELGDEKEVFYPGAQYTTTEVPAPESLFTAEVPVPMKGGVSHVDIVVDPPAEGDGEAVKTEATSDV